MKLRRLRIVALFSLSIAAAVNAQQATQGGPPPGGRQGGPPPGQFPGAPPRDARTPAQTGTAVIRGRVFAADTGRPLRRARITVSPGDVGAPGGPPGDNKTMSTSVDGRYEIKDLPAGRYTMSVQRSGYLQLRYGQRRPFEQGKPLQIADKQVLENIDFTLPRMSLITGRVFDEAGEPIAQVQMFAMRSVFFEGRRRLVPVAGGPTAQTDDAGQYRLLGLAPGSYFVSANMRETWTVAEGGIEAVMGYAPTYFPGTTGVTDARRVTVGVGQEASNTDLALVPGRAANVSGTAVDSLGRPLAGRQVGLRQSWRGPGFGLFFGGQGSPIAADGTFTIRNLSPGEYTLQVQATADINGTSVQESANVPIVMNGVNVDNLAISTSTGWSIAGQVTTESGEPPKIPRDRTRVVARPLNGDQGGPGGANNPDNGRLKDDWTFTVASLFGPSRLRVNLPDDWAVKAILQNGRDVSDAPLEMRNGETLSNLQIVVTDKVNIVSGQLTDAKGAPATDGTIIVFATDADRWAEDSRFVRSARPDQEGKYQIRGLPPGEYLAVAIDYVEEGMWNDPEYLESVRRHGQRLKLGENGTQAVALKLVMP